MSAELAKKAEKVVYMATHKEDRLPAVSLSVKLAGRERYMYDFLIEDCGYGNTSALLKAAIRVLGFLEGQRVTGHPVTVRRVNGGGKETDVDLLNVIGVGPATQEKRAPGKTRAQSS